MTATHRPRLTDRQAEAIGSFSPNMSHTALFEFGVSPHAFLRYRMKERESTQAMRAGTFGHALLLEPELAYGLFEPSPTAPANTVEGKAIWRAWVASHGAIPLADNKAGWIAAVETATGKEVLEAAQIEEKTRMVWAVNQNEAAMGLLLEMGAVEKFIEWDFAGLHFRGRLDMEGDEVTGDLKTCPDASAETILRNMKIWPSRVIHGQHVVPAEIMQAAHYSTCTGKKHYLLFVDKDCEVMVCEVSDASIEKALARIEFLAERYLDLLNQSRRDPSVFLKSQDFWTPKTYGYYQF